MEKRFTAKELAALDARIDAALEQRELPALVQEEPVQKSLKEMDYAEIPLNPGLKYAVFGNAIIAAASH